MPIVRPQNLNSAFQMASDQAKQRLPELTHNQKVRLVGRVVGQYNGSDVRMDTPSTSAADASFVEFWTCCCCCEFEYRGTS